jgi:maleate cis-trans isomerase
MARTRRPGAAASPLSALEALRFLGAGKIAIASPMPRIQNEQLSAYFEEAGVKITNVGGQ